MLEYPLGRIDFEAHLLPGLNLDLPHAQAPQGAPAGDYPITARRQFQALCIPRDSRQSHSVGLGMPGNRAPPDAKATTI